MKNMKRVQKPVEHDITMGKCHPTKRALDFLSDGVRQEPSGNTAGTLMSSKEQSSQVLKSR